MLTRTPIRTIQHSARHAHRRMVESATGEKLVSVQEAYRLWVAHLGEGTKARRSFDRYKDEVYAGLRTEILHGHIPAYSKDGTAPRLLLSEEAGLDDLLKSDQAVYVRAQDVVTMARASGLHRTTGGLAKWWFGDLYTPLLKGLQVATDFEPARAAGTVSVFNQPNDPQDAAALSQPRRRYRRQAAKPTAPLTPAL